ncbi:tyrosine-type recombinase/integrase [Paenarthrobacter sp. PH39-S1]|uniref:tyrosine-type recombinase/integrase n=1 Tax=Paenarthrobacter sp. PH39-S1 TaxID=3046204 RepID=UPI0024B8D3DD|nr:tyrosine-type recombinase/integrase [Paenarthrobacter sp. PH39-S1]MDJ0358500.1 tyrosine-type recombinase/integrase [Paenarthrobacter sp. PH39-S1]
MGIPATKVSKVRMRGPLAPFAPAFRSALKELGYTPLTMASELRMAADTSRWLEEQGLGARDVTSARIREFVAARHSAGRISPYPHRVFNTVVGILVERGVIQAENSEPAPGSPVDVLLASFETFMLVERGLVQCTATAYVLRARRFLARQAPGGDLAGLATKDVTDAVRAEAAMVSVGSTQFFVVAVRSFLRFCFIEGLLPTDLSGAALSITGRSRSPLAAGISAADARKLLDSCHRRSSEGHRDYAVLLTLLRLGLRASEVAALTLDDIDWRAGLIVVHGKGHRDDRLPLPADVGAAITGYLQRGRPRTTGREVFLRSLAPVEALSRAGSPRSCAAPADVPVCRRWAPTV